MPSITQSGPGECESPLAINSKFKQDSGHLLFLLTAVESSAVSTLFLSYFPKKLSSDICFSFTFARLILRSYQN